MKRPLKPTPTNRGAYAVVKDRGKRASMILVGQIMDNGDGSLMIYLDALPLSRTLLIRDRPDTESLPTLTSGTTSPVRSGPNEA